MGPNNEPTYDVISYFSSTHPSPENIFRCFRSIFLNFLISLGISGFSKRETFPPPPQRGPRFVREDCLLKQTPTKLCETRNKSRLVVSWLLPLLKDKIPHDKHTASVLFLKHWT